MSGSRPTSPAKSTHAKVAGVIFTPEQQRVYDESRAETQFNSEVLQNMAKISSLHDRLTGTADNTPPLLLQQNQMLDRMTKFLSACKEMEKQSHSNSASNKEKLKELKSTGDQLGVDYDSLESKVITLLNDFDKLITAEDIEKKYVQLKQVMPNPSDPTVTGKRKLIEFLTQINQQKDGIDSTMAEMQDLSKQIGPYLQQKGPHCTIL